MRSIAGMVACAACLSVLVRADARPPTPQDAVAMRTKIQTIYTNAERNGGTPQRTTITEPELNAYLIYDAKEQLPQGVVDPYVTMVGGGRVSARAVVDLDGVKGENSGGFFNPLRLLGGRLPVSTTGVLRSSDGTARYDLETAQVSGLTVPKSLLQQVLSYYSKTPENPNGISLDEPFPLPARIERIEVGTAQAVIVQ